MKWHNKWMQKKHEFSHQPTEFLPQPPATCTELNWTELGAELNWVQGDSYRHDDSNKVGKQFNYVNRSFVDCEQRSTNQFWFDIFHPFQHGDIWLLLRFILTNNTLRWPVTAPVQCNLNSTAFVSLAQRYLFSSIYYYKMVLKKIT